MPFGIEVETKRGKKVHPILEGTILHVKMVDDDDHPFFYLPKRGALAKQTGEDELTVVAPKTPTHIFHGTGVFMLTTEKGKLVFIPPAEKPSK